MSNPLEVGSRISENYPTEGELYRVVTTFGRSFELRYGYYDDCDRSRSPDVIYPDFLRCPIYTDRNEPFATMMQDACEYYEGERACNEDTTCSECKYFVRGEEWFGICSCPQKRHRIES